MTDTIIILAAGLSSRMQRSNASSELTKGQISAANSSSKSILKVGKSNRPLLHYLLRNAANAGFTRVLLVVGNSAAEIREFAQQYVATSNQQLTIDFAVQQIPQGCDKPQGTADALLQALIQYPDIKTSVFAVCNADNLYSVQALKSLRTHSSDNVFIAYDRDALNYSDERIASFAICHLSAHGQLIDIIEKPTSTQLAEYQDDKGSVRVSMNLWKFSGKDIFKPLKECPLHPVRAEKELPTAVLNMIRKFQQPVLAIPISEHLPDLTSKDDLLDLQDLDL